MKKFLKEMGLAAGLIGAMGGKAEAAPKHEVSKSAAQQVEQRIDAEDSRYMQEELRKVHADVNFSEAGQDVFSLTEAVVTEVFAEIERGGGPHVGDEQQHMLKGFYAETVINQFIEQSMPPEFVEEFKQLDKSRVKAMEGVKDSKIQDVIWGVFTGQIEKMKKAVLTEKLVRSEHSAQNRQALKEMLKPVLEKGIKERLQH